MIENEGAYPLELLFHYKGLFVDIPDTILAYNDAQKQTSKILRSSPTQAAVIERRKHQVLHTIDVGATTSKILAVLNKISEENVDYVIGEIVNIDNINERECINEFVKIILEKVSKEKYYVNLYAKIFEFLDDKIRTKLNSRSLNDSNSTYNKVLLNKSRELFEKFSKLKTPTQLGELSKEEKELYVGEYAILLDVDGNIDKKKIINIVDFIGWMYNFRLLNVVSVDYCLTVLIKNITTEYGVEAIITLLKTIKPKYASDENGHFADCVSALKTLKPTCSASRDRFMIQDFLDGRK